MERQHPVFITEGAKREIRNIVSYLREQLHSEQAADGFVVELRRKVRSISEMPELYPVSRLPEIAAFGYRSTLVKNYVLLYLVADDGSIIIEHVFHSRQDYGNLI